MARNAAEVAMMQVLLPQPKMSTMTRFWIVPVVWTAFSYSQICNIVNALVIVFNPIYLDFQQLSPPPSRTMTHHGQRSRWLLVLRTPWPTSLYISPWLKPSHTVFRFDLCTLLSERLDAKPSTWAAFCTAICASARVSDASFRASVAKKTSNNVHWGI